MAAPIRILPVEVVNKIAAGEVIERPASVVKELVENALDAGATEIRVDVEEGGRKLVRVADNGGGIPADELPLAFAPHATNKLQTAEDLFRVSSFGFRGEALSSIGAVARVRLVSRTPEGEGAEIVVECGQSTGVRPAPAAPGTTVEVRNLFQNVPVRRRFLRSMEVEAEHVGEAIARFSVAHPRVRFDLYLDGALRHALPPSDRRSRIGAFFGEDLAAALRETETAPFHAYLAPPQFSKLSARGVYFFLNGRYIRDRVLLRGVQEAYRELLPHGRSPIAFLFFELPSSEVDVNVHPTKIEVRFRNVWKLHDRIATGLREELLGTDLDPRVDPVAGAQGPLSRSMEGPAREVVDFFRREPDAPLLAVEAPPLVTTGRRVFQLHDRYLVEEVEDGLRILDQHALHERVLLAQFRKEYAQSTIARQRLLLPAIVRLSRERRALLEGARELLESFGLEAQEFGPDEVAVRAVPALVSEHDPGTLLTDFLDLAEEDEGDVPLLERALEFLACRAAVKFGKKLSEEEIARLLADARGLDFSSTCAHGRPTAIKLTLADLERFFHR